MISAVKEVTTWKWIPEYPVFTDPLEDWTIELSSNKTENDGVVEYKSIEAKDYQEDSITATFDFDGHKFLSGISNSNNGTFTFYADTKKMKVEKSNFFIYV